MVSLLKNSNIIAVCPSTALAAGSTVVLSTQVGYGPVDMAGYESVTFIYQPAIVVANSVNYLYPTFGSSSGSLTADTSAAVGWATGATSYSLDFLALEIYKPTQRYVGWGMYRLTANSAGGIIAIQYLPRKGATTQATAGSVDYMSLGTTVYAGLTS